MRSFIFSGRRNPSKPGTYEGDDKRALCRREGKKRARERLAFEDTQKKAKKQKHKTKNKHKNRESKVGTGTPNSVGLVVGEGRNHVRKENNDREQLNRVD